MARKISRLKAVHLDKKQPGMHCDGLGLYLQVTDSGSRSWVYRFKLKGRSRDMGLGSLVDVSLAEAREKATDARRLLRERKDPIENRKAQQAADRLAEAQSKTFRQAAEEYIAAHEASWRNKIHRLQWKRTLIAYAYPTIGDLPVNQISTQHVRAVLEPIWATKTTTASRVRGRIETIINAARADDDSRWSNPAQWERHKHKFPRPSKIAPTRHHASLPYTELPAFMAQLRAREGITARALEFAILTACRTKEVRGARWDEFNIAERLWVIPGARMKAGKEHSVVLSARARNSARNGRDQNRRPGVPGRKGP
jgi:integrase